MNVNYIRLRIERVKMKLKNCEISYDLYVESHYHAQVCSRCQKIEQSDLQKIKRYLRQNPRADILEIQEKLNISSEKLLRFKREGRI
jgi:Fe2+ or Zn2+ uptake regulation protein